MNLKSETESYNLFAKITYYKYFVKKLCEVIGAQYGRVASLATVDDAGTQSHLEGLVTKTSL